MATKKTAKKKVAKKKVAKKSVVKIDKAFAKKQKEIGKSFLARDKSEADGLKAHKK